MDLLKIETNKYSSDLLDIFFTNGIIPTITRPTRITHTSATLIDNIYIKHNCMNNIIYAIIITDISDHIPILSYFGSKIEEQPDNLTFKCRRMKDIQINKIVQSLEMEDWHSLLTTDANINTAYDNFIAKLWDIINTHAPEKKTVTINKKHIIRQPWLTSGIFQSIKTRDKLFRKCIRKPRDSSPYQKYQKYRNMLNSLKRNMKYNYYDNLLTKYKHDIKKTWKVLNTIIGRTNDKTSIPDNFIIDGSHTDDKNKIAEEFCNYFSNVGQKLAANIPNVGIDPLSYLTKEKSVMNSIYLNPTSPEEIFKVIRTIKPSRSCGPDNISNKLLKQINSAICTPISCLINKSLETGTVPTSMKIASHTCIQIQG